MSEAVYLEEIKIKNSKVSYALSQLKEVAEANNLRLSRPAELRKSIKILIKSIYFI